MNYLFSWSIFICHDSLFVYSDFWFDTNLYIEKPPTVAVINTFLLTLKFDQVVGRHLFIQPLLKPFSVQCFQPSTLLFLFTVITLVMNVLSCRRQLLPSKNNPLCLKLEGSDISLRIWWKSKLTLRAATIQIKKSAESSYQRLWKHDFLPFFH